MKGKGYRIKFTNYFQLVYKLDKIVYNNEHKIGVEGA